MTEIVFKRYNNMRNSYDFQIETADDVADILARNHKKEGWKRGYRVPHCHR